MIDPQTLLKSAPWLLGLGAASGMIFSFWGQIKGSFQSAASFLLVRVSTDHEIAGPVLVWLNKHGKRITLEPHLYVGRTEYVKPLSRVRKIAVRFFGGKPQMYFYKGWPIWFTSPDNQSQQGNGNVSREFSFIRGTVDWQKVMCAALDDEDAFKSSCTGKTVGRYRVRHIFGQSLGRMGAYKNSLSGEAAGRAMEAPRSVNPSTDVFDRFSGFSPVGWNHEDLGIPQTSSMESMALDDELSAVVKEVRFWYNSKSWFQERSIAWRCGLMLHGAPGTGKTSLSRALAEELDLPVFVFDLASMTNAEFINEWRSALSESPCMVLLEDIDGVFHGRKNVSVKDGDGGLTFDCLLNSLDGIEKAEGVLLVVTTNDLDKVDPALGRAPELDDVDGMPSRPGRIDRVVEFRKLTEAGLRKVAMRIVRDAEMAEQLVKIGGNDTGAQFQLRCVRLARKQFFDRGALIEFAKREVVAQIETAINEGVIQ